MDTKNTLSITDARKKIFDIADEVQKPSVHFTLTENGKPKAVIMSADEFESWQETMETLIDFPDIEKDIEELERAKKTGEYKNWITLQELLSKEGLLLSDKAKKQYGVSNNRKIKGAKRSKKVT